MSKKGPSKLVSRNSGYDMRPKKYADGGEVSKDKPKPKPKPKPAPPPPPPPPKEEKKISFMDAISGKARREREAELGLKDGGKVRKRRRK